MQRVMMKKNQAFGVNGRGEEVAWMTVECPQPMRWTYSSSVY